MNLHRLAIVLKHANSSPPPHCREEFYRLKQAILERFGEKVGEDVQHIRRACWSCTDGVFRGRGYYSDEYPDGEICFKCNGSGVYLENWIVLDRWSFQGLIFHRPVRTLVGSLVPANIEGVIKHRESKLAFACWRVLTVMFDPQFCLYLDQFKQDEKTLRRFKAVLAYLLEFPRRKWQVEPLKYQAFVDVKKRYAEAAV